MLHLAHHPLERRDDVWVPQLGAQDGCVQERQAKVGGVGGGWLVGWLDHDGVRGMGPDERSWRLEGCLVDLDESSWRRLVGDGG